MGAVTRSLYEPWPGRLCAGAARSGKSRNRTVALNRSGAERVGALETWLARWTSPDGATAPAGLKGKDINPLLFINWSSVSSLFRGLMWIMAIALAAVIIVHLVPAASSAHHAVRMMR